MKNITTTKSGTIAVTESQHGARIFIDQNDSARERASKNGKKWPEGSNITITIKSLGPDGDQSVDYNLMELIGNATPQPAAETE